MKHATRNKNRIQLKIVSNIFIWLSVATDTTFRAGAALATSVLIDNGIIEPNDTKFVTTSVLIDDGIIEPNDTKFVINRSKLQRERMRHREEMRKEEKELFGKVDGIYVDGKKDATLVLKEVDGKYSRKVEIEEHIVMVGPPGEFYLIPVHTSPDSGTGLSIATSIYNKINDTDLADKLNVTGSDGTAAMTGAHN